MSYIGQQPLNNFVTKQSQEFTPDGSTTGFTLNFAVTSGTDILLMINNVVQEPGAGNAYTASGTTLTMSEAPSASDSMYCIFLGLALQTVNPGDGSVGTAKLTDSAVTTAKINNSAITNAKIASDAAIATTKLGAGAVLQVVQTHYSGATSFASNSAWADIDVFDTSITPSSTSSKILVEFNVNISSANLAYTKLRRGTTDIAVGDAASSRIQCSTGHGSYSGDTNRAFCYSVKFIDSPSSTSQLDYNVQGYCETTNTAYINRSHNDPDSDTGYRMVSSLTLTEIAG